MKFGFRPKGSFASVCYCLLVDVLASPCECVARMLYESMKPLASQRLGAFLPHSVTIKELQGVTGTDTAADALTTVSHFLQPNATKANHF